MADEYTGETNKFGNAVGLPFSSFGLGTGALDLAFAADDLRRMNDMFWLDGVRQDSSDWSNGDGAVRWVNGFNIMVRPLRAHVNGTIVFSEQVSLVIEVEAASTRIDSVVIRRDYTARTVNIMVVRGVSGSGNPPALLYNDGGVADMELARITVRNNMDMLAQTDIADMRKPLLADFGVRPTVNDIGSVVTVGGHGSLGIVPRHELRYELCEFYYFRHPTLKPGFQPAQGGLLANAATIYPEAWAYLQTVEGQKLCKTEAAWQALTTVTWATLADGTKVGWNGIGGAPFYAPNTSTGALRLPDLRGMYAEASGYDSLGVGGTHGDAARNIVGTAEWAFNGLFSSSYGTSKSTGAITLAQSTLQYGASSGNNGYQTIVSFNASRVIPTATKNQPRAWGALACVYLGISK